MTFAFIVKSNLKKKPLLWMTEQTTGFDTDHIPANLHQTDEEWLQQVYTLSAHTKALQLQPLWLLLSFNVCICMPIKNSLVFRQLVKVGPTIRPCHRIWAIFPISTHTSCPECEPLIHYFLFCFCWKTFKNLAFLSQSWSIGVVLLYAT